MDYIHDNKPYEKFHDDIQGEIEKDPDQTTLEGQQERNLSNELKMTLDEFSPVSNKFLSMFMEILPFAVSAFVLIDSLVTQRFLPDDSMLLTGLLAVTISAFLLSYQINKLPGVLRGLWDGGLVDLRKNGQSAQSDDSKRVNRIWWRRLFKRSRPASGSLDEDYRIYIQDFQRWLNSRLSWILGLYFVWIISKPHPIHWGYSLDLALGRFCIYIIAFAIGLLTWRIIFIAVMVLQLGNRFDLAVKLQHPDKSGGLKPLGDLCFINALIVSVLGIYLGGWIFIMVIRNPAGQIPEIPFLIFSDQGDFISFFSRLLILFVILAILVFIIPLYSVHLSMLRKKAEIQHRLEAIGLRIDRLTRLLLERAEDMGVGEAEEIAKEIDQLQQVYESNRMTPVWPFDVSHLIKFITAQIPPVLGLTALDEPMKVLIQTILGINPG